MLLVPLLALGGCGERPKLERLPSDAIVLAFGDSLTFGTGATETRATRRSSSASSAGAWCAPVCRAKSAAQALARLPGALDEHTPRLLLLCIGGNDFLRRWAILRPSARARDGPPRPLPGRSGNVDRHPGARLHRTPPAFYSAIAKEFRLPYEEGIIGQVLRDGSLKADPIHPNARGYRVIAERVADQLKRKRSDLRRADLSGRSTSHTVRSARQRYRSNRFTVSS
jgi:lysophospholipase L1-like esterase